MAKATSIKLIGQSSDKWGGSHVVESEKEYPLNRKNKTVTWGSWLSRGIIPKNASSRCCLCGNKNIHVLVEHSLSEINRIKEEFGRKQMLMPRIKICTLCKKI